MGVSSKAGDLGKKTSNKSRLSLSTDDRIRIFANIIVERILEDSRQDKLQYKSIKGR